MFLGEMLESALFALSDLPDELCVARLVALAQEQIPEVYGQAFVREFLCDTSRTSPVVALATTESNIVAMTARCRASPPFDPGPAML